MSQPIRIALAVLVTSLAFGGGAPVRAEDPPAASTREAVEQAMKGYAATLKGGTPEAVAGWYMPDGELLLPGLPPVHGRQAIRAFLAPMVGAVDVESVEVGTDLVEVHGETADLWGTYRQLAGEKGKPKEMHAGRYAALWHREAGTWRLVRLMMQPVPTDAH
jgi:uncharacterized protein (TIGR02246 family)